MKNLIVLLLLIVATPCSAQTILEDEAGNYYVFSSQELKENKLNVVGDAKYYTSFFSKAIARPDRPIFIKDKKEFKKLKLVFREVMDVESLSILYNEETKTIKPIRKISAKEKTSYLILFVILSLISMILSNIFKDNKTKIVFAFLSFLFIFPYAVLSSVFLSPDKVASMFMLVIFLVSFIVPMLILGGENRKYRWFSVAYYVAMPVFITSLFI